MEQNSCLHILKYAFDTLELSNKTEVTKWLNYTNENIEIMNKSIKSAISVIRQEKLEKTLRNLEKYKLALSQMIELLNGDTSCSFGSIIWKDVESAFDNRIQTGILNNIRHKDPRQFLFAASKVLIMNLQKQLRRKFMMKLTTLFSVELKKLSSNQNKLEFLHKHINSSARIVDQGSSLQILSRNIQKEILAELEKSEEIEGGWTLSEIISLTVTTNEFAPLDGTYFPTLPQEIVINQNCDHSKKDVNNCFAWSIVNAICKPVGRQGIITSYPHYNSILNMNGISNPIKLTEISVFEKNNVISVNVFLLQTNKTHFKVIPIRLTTDKQAAHVNLLMFHESYLKNKLENFVIDTNNINFDDMNMLHFCWIKNLSKLMAQQLTGYLRTSVGICDRCLEAIYSEDVYKKHILDCNNVDHGNADNDNVDNDNVDNGNDGTSRDWLSFKKFCNRERSPYVIYAGINSFVNQSFCKNLTDDNTNNLCKHKIFNIGYYFLCSYDSTLNYYNHYRGKDALKWFACELKTLAENMETTFICKVPAAQRSRELNYELNTQTHCYFCGKEFTSDEEPTLFNCNMTGNAKGMTHFKCLEKFEDVQTAPIVSIILHNMTDEESDYIPKKIFSQFDGNLSLQLFNERFVGFTQNADESNITFRFIDSYCFLPFNLNELISICNNLTFIKTECPNYHLLMGKHVPHNCFTNWLDLNETHLPLEINFSNRLSRVKLCQENYNYAQTIWSTFKIQSMGDYSDLYLKCDIMRLVEVFEEFRNICISAYSLDPTHYLTPSEFSWDAMLKYTGVELKPIPNKILPFIVRAMQPEIIQCNAKYSKANNTYMKNFNEFLNVKYLMYFNVNNLYEWAFSQYLPNGDYRWMTEIEIEHFDVNKIIDESNKGYMLEVDLEYPINVQQKHKFFPFISELKLNQKSIERYVVHYRSLQQFLKNEIVLKRVHKILEFSQSPWLQNYIDLNIALRIMATNPLEKNIYSLMNYSLISNGKIFENIKKTTLTKLMTSWNGNNGARNFITKQNFLSSDIIDEKLVAIRVRSKRFEIEKPVALKQAVIAIAKTNIYDFHYDFMARSYADQQKCLYVDADTIIYELLTNDIYKKIRQTIHKFTTTGYSKVNEYGIPQANKILPGLVRDLLNGKILTEFVAIRPKMYSIKVENNSYMDDQNERKDLLINRSIDFNYILKSI